MKPDMDKLRLSIPIIVFPYNIFHSDSNKENAHLAYPHHENLQNVKKKRSVRRIWISYQRHEDVVKQI